MTSDRFGSGTDFLDEQNKATGSTRQRGSGIWKLWLREGETAQFYFGTDGNQMLVPLIHLKTVARPGRKPFTVEVLCSKRTAEDETACSFCDADPVEKDGKAVAAFPGPYTRLVAYAYVVSVFHPSRPQGKDWEALSTPTGTVYREDVNDVRLIIAKFKLQDAIRAAYAGDVTDPDYDPAKATLLDRAYRLIVTGSGGRTQEQLVPSSRLGYPDEVKAKLAEMPPLADTVIAEFDDDFKPGAATVAKGNTPAQPVAAAPAEDGGGFEDGGSPDAAAPQAGDLEDVAF